MESKLEKRLVSLFEQGMISTQKQVDDYIAIYFDGVADAGSIPQAELQKTIKLVKEQFRCAFCRPFYFTFGSAKQFPFHCGYIVLYAEDIRAAARVFKSLYPNPSEPEVLNCSDYYSQEEWTRITQECYKDEAPLKVIGEGGYFYEYSR